MNRSEKLSLLFSEDYRIIDFLPRAVSTEEDDFYEEAEQYFLQDKHLQVFCDKTIAIVLKVLCYFPFEIYVWEEYKPGKQERGVAEG